MNDDASDPLSGTAPGNTGEENGNKPWRSSADHFRLRPECPRVMRLLRKVLAGLFQFKKQFLHRGTLPALATALGR